MAKEISERDEKALQADKNYRDRMKSKDKKKTAKGLKFNVTAPVMPKLRGDDITPEAKEVEAAIIKWEWFPKKK